MDEPVHTRFSTTRWSVVLRARDGLAGDGPAAALQELYASYWPAVYAYLRRKGRPASDAGDLCQDFFIHLLESELLARVEPRGRFRSFLLTTLEHYLANRWRMARAQKRGGGRAPLPLELADGERTWQRVARGQEQPGEVFDRVWALEVLGRALESLRGDLAAQGHSAGYELLVSYLTATGSRPSYAELADRLECSVTQVARLLHTSRRRLQSHVRSVLAETVTAPEQLDEELRDLFRAL